MTVDNYQGQTTTETYAVTFMISKSTTNNNQVIISAQGSTNTPSATVSDNTASYSNYNFTDPSGDKVVENLNISINGNTATVNGTDSYNSTAGAKWIDTSTGTLTK